MTSERIRPQNKDKNFLTGKEGVSKKVRLRHAKTQLQMTVGADYKKSEWKIHDPRDGGEIMCKQGGRRTAENPSNWDPWRTDREDRGRNKRVQPSFDKKEGAAFLTLAAE